MFAQYGFNGQAVLFAQDILKVITELPNMLPTATGHNGIVVITEALKNLDNIR